MMEKLTIRRIQAEDWPALRQIWLDQSRSVYAQYDRPCDLAPEAVRSRIATWGRFACSTEHMFFAVCLAQQVIGYISMNRRADGYETGYCFHSAYHGHGYARESLKAVMEQLTNQGITQHFIAGTALKNTPSVKLLTAVGFAQTGTERVSFYQDETGRAIFFEGGIFEAWSDNDHGDQ